MQSYLPIHLFNKVCYISNIALCLFFVLYRVVFNTLGGCVSATQPTPTWSPTSRSRTTRFVFTEHSRVRSGTTLCHPNQTRTSMICSQALIKGLRDRFPPTRQIQKRTQTVGITLTLNKKHYLHKYCSQLVHSDQLSLQQNK